MNKFNQYLSAVTKHESSSSTLSVRVRGERFTVEAWWESEKTEVRITTDDDTPCEIVSQISTESIRNWLWLKTRLVFALHLASTMPPGAMWDVARDGLTTTLHTRQAGVSLTLKIEGLVNQEVNQ